MGNQTTQGYVIGPSQQGNSPGTDPSSEEKPHSYIYGGVVFDPSNVIMATGLLIPAYEAGVTRVLIDNFHGITQDNIDTLIDDFEGLLNTTQIFLQSFGYVPPSKFLHEPLEDEGVSMIQRCTYRLPWIFNMIKFFRTVKELGIELVSVDVEDIAGTDRSERNEQIAQNIKENLNNDSKVMMLLDICTLLDTYSENAKHLGVLSRLDHEFLQSSAIYFISRDEFTEEEDSFSFNMVTLKQEDVIINDCMNLDVYEYLIPVSFGEKLEDITNDELLIQRKGAIIDYIYQIGGYVENTELVAKTYDKHDYMEIFFLENVKIPQKFLTDIRRQTLMIDSVDIFVIDDEDMEKIKQTVVGLTIQPYKHNSIIVTFANSPDNETFNLTQGLIIREILDQYED